MRAKLVKFFPFGIIKFKADSTDIKLFAVVTCIENCTFNFSTETFSLMYILNETPELVKPGFR